MRGGWRARWSIAALMVLRCSSQDQLIEDAVPRPEPDAGGPATSAVSTFAIYSLSLGDATNGNLPSSTWEILGYNLDGKVTASSSTDVCVLVPGAPQTNQADGVGGRDDAFAGIALPVVETVVGDTNLTQSASQAMQQGRFTLQIQVSGLSDDSSQTADGLVVDIFASDEFDTPPVVFDSSADWPVLPESLADSVSIAGGARAHFSAAYVTNGTFVAGTNEHVTVPLHANINRFAFTLPIHEAIVTFNHVASNEADDGVLAGVVDPAELISIVRRFLGGFDAQLCGPGFNPWIQQQLAEAADILADRTNHAGTPCTAISFGMGFRARRIANPTKVAAPLDYPDPCDAAPSADAGPDSD